METTIYIEHGEKIYFPAVKEGIKLSSERKGSPSKLTFECYKDNVLKIEEGDAVVLKQGSTKMFYGFVFTIGRDRTNVIKVTAYDQLRYLKNKETYVYENKKVGDVVKMVAKDFLLQTGTIESGSYSIPSMVEDTVSLFDIIQNAMDEELKNTGILYVLYDDSGKICLKNFEHMTVPIIIDEETGQNYSYNSSIDKDTYNQIKLTYDNEDTGKRDVYMTKDSSHINKWGLLQYTEKIQKGENGVAKSEALLKLYNSKVKSLSVTGCAGDERVRAGCCVVVKLDLGDISLCNYMLVEKCSHEFNNGLHTMDLTLHGGEINSAE